MTDTIRYPLDDMINTSASLRSFLDQQWSQHTALFMTGEESHAALLNAIAGVIPHEGGKAQELANALQHYHQQYHTCYQALYALADQIDAAARAMHLNDVQSASTFEGIE